MIARLACPFKSDWNTNPRRYIRGVCTKELLRYRVVVLRPSCRRVPAKTFEIERLSRDVAVTYIASRHLGIIGKEFSHFYSCYFIWFLMLTVKIICLYTALTITVRK